MFYRIVKTIIFGKVLMGVKKLSFTIKILIFSDLNCLFYIFIGVSGCSGFDEEPSIAGGQNLNFWWRGEREQTGRAGWNAGGINRIGFTFLLKKTVDWIRYVTREIIDIVTYFDPGNFQKWAEGTQMKIYLLYRSVLTINVMVSDIFKIFNEYHRNSWVR